MTLEQFEEALKDKERLIASITEMEGYAVELSSVKKELDDAKIELSSFEKECKDLKSQQANVNEELRKTKELNFTLARQVNAGEKRSSEDILYNMFSDKTDKRGGELRDGN